MQSITSSVAALVD